MGRTRIKICGLTREQDIDAAVQAGADSIGFVFCEKSPRHLEVSRAVELARRVPAFVSVVALFLNPQRDLVEQVLAEVQPELLQFHGNETAEFCGQFARRYLKAVAMGGMDDGGAAQAQAHPAACGYVLDSHAPGMIGGTGETFDWQRIDVPAERSVLAGGLNPANVAEAITLVRPWAVDVSSGLEDAPGIKSADKIRDFIAAVGNVDRGLQLEQ